MNQEQLLTKLNDALTPKFKAVIGDIPADYIDVPANTSKSTKYVGIENNEGETYLDWYFDTFSIDTVKNEMERVLSHRDRDMDPITAGEFSYIAQRTLAVLK